MSVFRFAEGTDLAEPKSVPPAGTGRCHLPPRFGPPTGIALFMSTEDARLIRLLETAKELEGFQLCGPSDDPDQQTAVVYGYKHLAKRFVGLARRIQHEQVQADIAALALNVESVYDVYDLHADLQLVIDDIRHIADDLSDKDWGLTGTRFVDHALISDLRLHTTGHFDLSKVAQLCDELNSAYDRGHYLSCTLLLRTLINHVPPVFGHSTFAQVVGQSSRSIKDLLRPLEDLARDIADHQAHSIVRHKEFLPTRAQIDPFRASVEILLQELVVRCTGDMPDDPS